MSRIQRSFVIGGEWLYYKIYTGPKTSDLVLTNIIKPVTTSLLKNKSIDSWFFIRYSDPKPHIRVRFLYTYPAQVGDIINALYLPIKNYVDEDLIWKVQIDTYQREIERYGESTMQPSEIIFFHDSTLIINFLDMVEGDEGEELRWLLGVRAIDTLLNDFKYDDDRKLKLLEGLKTGFGAEFHRNKFLTKQLDKKFRDEKDKIDNFLNFEKEDHPDYAPILDILEERSIQSKAAVTAILSAVTTESELDSLMRSHIHMHMNRLFRSKNRLHEMVIYDLLYRTYKVAWGIRKFNKKAKN
ncbi:thiopeptide-type bacteriocin biosynthesis protein [Aquimarina sp. U1-2]|uniref:thiopeptide-type bacteriocin biosynthesis protein n=1 Tax=Aquimarina sp. U1-2 TaxID=2823141 RepID=UPI001AECFE23|nr:thiopeptide-type bacteriocin biosynthesis protein [Aquimarina sp. U1-2]MBP2834101.1 thiopeptide-type bacteriocin biosynthesis protein [Aquimarina sp. U1-2]